MSNEISKEDELKQRIATLKQQLEDAEGQLFKDTFEKRTSQLQVYVGKCYHLTQSFGGGSYNPVIESYFKYIRVEHGCLIVINFVDDPEPRLQITRVNQHTANATEITNHDFVAKVVAFFTQVQQDL